MRAKDTVGLFMHEQGPFGHDDLGDFDDEAKNMKKKPTPPLTPASPAKVEKNCAFFGGHFWSANPGVQSCLWCTATRLDLAQAPK